MKKTLPVICFLLITKLSVAQSPFVTVDTADKKSRILSLTPNSILPQSIFSHSTPKGKVYILPYDNMPCLVPNMQQLAPMPGSTQRFPESRMPNAIPRRDLIPKPKKQTE